MANNSKAKAKPVAKTPAKKTTSKPATKAPAKKEAPKRKEELKKAVVAKQEVKGAQTQKANPHIPNAPKNHIEPRTLSLSLKDDKKHDYSVSEKLIALYDLQQIDSKVDKIRIVRGELPMEVRDLEDDVAGLETRITNISNEIHEMETNITNKKQTIKDANALIKKYTTQQNNVKNNREYESLTKEIEFQNLEIQLAEKRIKEYTAEIGSKNMIIEAARTNLSERKQDLEVKKHELDGIIKETQKEEEVLLKKSENAAKIIENRLYAAYKRIRNNARNGLAVVTVQRDSCGGCFNQIPPQQQLDIRQRKKIIVCEHCGRILVDPNITE
jgi:predicted  nucleic acid-binding Zn-ribbon protein